MLLFREIACKHKSKSNSNINLIIFFYRNVAIAVVIVALLCLSLQVVALQSFEILSCLLNPWDRCVRRASLRTHRPPTAPRLGSSLEHSHRAATSVEPTPEPAAGIAPIWILASRPDQPGPVLAGPPDAPTPYRSMARIQFGAFPPSSNQR